MSTAINTSPGIAPARCAETALHLLEHVMRFGDQAIGSYCESVGMNQAELDSQFLEWCGRSTEEFLFFASHVYSRQQLRGSDDLFFVHNERSRQSHVPVKITRMSEAEALSVLQISFSYVPTVLGPAFMAEMDKGIVYLSFGDSFENEKELSLMFPRATFSAKKGAFEKPVADLVASPASVSDVIPVFMKCTAFQHTVWEKLLSILPGSFITYGELAASVGDKNASRAVGAALASNPVAWLIPCHRVVNADGSYGNFRWGPARKKLFLAWEAACLHR